MFLLAKIIEWNIIEPKGFNIDQLIEFTKQDKTGSILLSQFGKDLNVDLDILKSYFKSINGQENDYNAKRSPKEIKQGGYHG